MALTLEEKKAVVAEVSIVAEQAHSVVSAEYNGLSVGEMTELRGKAREANVYLRVIKNSLARQAIAGTECECMKETLVGPLLLAFSQEDPGSAARVLNDFSKDHEKLVLKAAAISGQLLEASEIARLASLPTKDQAISMLMSVIIAPVGKLAKTLNEVPGKLVRTVDAVRASKAA